MIYDEETGELAVGACEPDPEEGGGGGDPWTEVPDPETGDVGGTTPEAFAAPWIAEVSRANQMAFDDAGLHFAVDQAQCNTLIARCHEDCGDRTAQRAGLCGSLVGLLALGPWPSKAAGVLIGGACVKQIYDLNAQCKSDCTFVACIPH